MIERITSKQREDPLLAERIRRLKVGTEVDDLKDFYLDQRGWLRKKGGLCVPDVENLRKQVLGECHRSKFTIHPGGTKIYQDMKRSFYWEGMKRDVGLWVRECVNCEQVKAEHQKPSGLLQPLEIPVWK